MPCIKNFPFFHHLIIEYKFNGAIKAKRLHMAHKPRN